MCYVGVIRLFQKVFGEKMINKEREVYVFVWEFIKYFVKEEEVLFGDFRYNLQM